MMTLALSLPSGEPLSWLAAALVVTSGTGFVVGAVRRTRHRA